MNIEIKYTFTEEEGKERLRALLQGEDLACAIHEFYSYLRDIWKYPKEKTHEPMVDAADVRDKLTEILDSYNIDLT